MNSGKEIAIYINVMEDNSKNTKLNISAFLQKQKDKATQMIERTLSGIKKLPEITKNVSKTVRETKFWKKEFWTQAYSNVRSRLPKNLEDIKNMQPDEVLGAVFGNTYTNFKRSIVEKNNTTYFKVAFVAFASYFLADTVSLFTDSFIPEAPIVPPPKIVKKSEKQRTVADFNVIIKRNIFNSKGLIPKDESLADQPARKTTLPLNLIGTVVLKDELKSIAAIEDKSANMVFPVRIDDAIDGKIKITKIEHFRVYFINESTGHNEYVEIVDDLPQFNIGVQTPQKSSAAPSGKSSGGVTQTNDSSFQIERSVIDKSMSNMGEVLQQARAVPNFENGMPDGYRLMQITPGSIYTQLGLKDNDVICGVNGESLNDPSKVFQMFNDIKSISHLELCVKRNGRKTVMNYDVK